MFSAVFYSSDLEWRCFVISSYDLCLSYKIGNPPHTATYADKQIEACAHLPGTLGFCTHTYQQKDQFAFCLSVCLSVWVTAEKWHQTFQTFSWLLQRSNSSVSEAGRLVWANAQPLWFSSCVVFESTALTLHHFPSEADKKCHSLFVWRARLWPRWVHTLF